MYSVVFKEMEFLMDEYNDQDDPLWCNLIYDDSYNSLIVLDDLKVANSSLIGKNSYISKKKILLNYCIIKTH